MKRSLMDLSHTVEHGMVTYKGLPAPIICDYLSREASRARYAPGTEFHIGKIEMVANTGTYVDSPFHRYADGLDLSQLPLERPAKGLLTGGVKLPLALAELGLIDEYEFVVQPRLAGHGPTLFAGLSKRIDLKLVSRVEFGSGAVAMRYEPRR